MKKFNLIFYPLFVLTVLYGCSDDKDVNYPYDYTTFQSESVTQIERGNFPVSLQVSNATVKQQDYTYNSEYGSFSKEFGLLDIIITYDPLEEYTSHPYLIKIYEAANNTPVTSFHSDLTIYTAVVAMEYKGDIPVYSSITDNNITKIRYSRGYYTYSGNVNPTEFTASGYIMKDANSTDVHVSIGGHLEGGATPQKLDRAVPGSGYENAIKSYIQKIYKDLGIN